MSSNSFEFVYDLNDFSIEISDIDIEITGFEDVSGNSGDTFLSEASFSIDTQAPELNTLELSDLVLNELLVGTETFSVTVTLDSDLNTTITPILTFNNVDVSNSLILNTDASGYEGENTYTVMK